MANKKSKKDKSSSKHAKKKSSGPVVEYVAPMFSGPAGCLTDGSDAFLHVQAMLAEKAQMEATVGALHEQRNAAAAPASLRHENAAAAAAAGIENEGGDGSSYHARAPLGARPPRRERTEEENACRLFVGGLPNHATEIDIRAAFAPHQVKALKIPESQEPGRIHRGFCFADFYDTATVEQILSMPPGSVLVAGHPVRVNQTRTATGGGGGGVGGGAGGAGAPPASDFHHRDQHGGAAHAQQPGTAAGGGGGGGGSRVAAITGLVDENGVVDTDLIEVIKTECSKYGAVRNVQFFRESASGNLITAAVEYPEHGAAKLCVQQMNGRLFDTRTLQSGLMNMEAYESLLGAR